MSKGSVQQGKVFLGRSTGTFLVKETIVGTLRKKDGVLSIDVPDGALGDVPAAPQQRVEAGVQDEDGDGGRHDGGGVGGAERQLHQEVVLVAPVGPEPLSGDEAEGGQQEEGGHQPQAGHQHAGGSVGEVLEREKNRLSPTIV